MTVSPVKAGGPPAKPKPGRPPVYHDALESILDEGSGDWWVLATFESVTGAKDAKARLFRNPHLVPGAGPQEFEWEVVRHKDEGTSELWVRVDV